MVFNKRDLEKAFSPGKTHRFARKNGGVAKPSTSGSTSATRNENDAATNSSSSSSSISGSSISGSSSIRVIVRVRPANERESQDNCRNVVKVVDEKMLIFDPKEEESPFYYRGVAQKGRDLLKKQNKELEFMFDRVFDKSCDNARVFEGTTKEAISGLLEGYNCSVFAYGATGAGKTHTMLGREDDPGITFRTMSELFARMEAQSDRREFTLGVTYLEVYNENVCDLLHKVGPLAIRDDGRHGIVVADLKIVKIHSADELFSLLARGNKNRTQHPTDANEESSRSHAVFQVYVSITEKLDGQKKHVKLSMIDLAGSERASATGCKGARFKEGANINKSLLALGNCINNLADGVKHIPYRDSKLTRLLKDSLGGNCRTVMIANVGPSSLSYEDTYNTLRYANRAKKIKLNIKKNIVSYQMHVTGYIKMVEEQKKEISMLKEKLAHLESQTRREGGIGGSRTAEGTESFSSPAAAATAAATATATPVEDSELAEMREKMRQLLKERARLNEKILSLQSADIILCCRIQYKIAADNRLKSITAAVESTHREEENASGKSRLKRSLLYFKRQREVVKLEMQLAWEDYRSIEMRIEALNLGLQAKKLSDKLLDECCTSQRCEIEKIRLRQQYEHAKKIGCLRQCEFQSIDTIARTISSTLQKYYDTMRGYGTLTEQMKQEYKHLIKSLEGVRNIKWADSESDKYSSEDSYVLTCLSTDELDDPFNSAMPIYRASYLEEDNLWETAEATFDGTPPWNSALRGVGAVVAAAPAAPAAGDGSSPPAGIDSTITLTENETERTNGEIDPPPLGQTTLNRTFEQAQTKSAKKRTLADKSQASSHSTPVKQAKKVSPRERVVPTTNPVLSGKENRTKAPSVMSAKSIAILNALKRDRLKLLPQLSNSTVESAENGDGSLCNKVVRPKERRALATTHPYQKTQAKPPSKNQTMNARLPGDPAKS